MNEKQGFEKNYFVAIALSALVLFVYFSLVKPPEQNRVPSAPAAADSTADLQKNQPAMPAANEAGYSAVKAEVSSPQPAQLIKLESPTIFMELSNLGATATILKFKGEPKRELLTQTSFFEGDIERPGIFSISIRGQAEQVARSVFKLTSASASEAVYVYEEPGAIKVTKTYKLLSDNPAIQLDVEVENLSTQEKTYPLEFSYSADYQHVDAHGQPGQYFDAMAFTTGLKTADVKKIEKKGFWISETSAWTALVKSYFALIVRPDRKILEARAEAHDGQATMINNLDPSTVPAGQKAVTRFKIYAGAQRYETLKKFEDGFEAVLSRGFFGLFKVWLLLILKFLHQFTHNFGWDILFLTLLIKIVFTPLTLISSKSMKKMQALAPRQKAIQEKYKNDPPKAQKEIMELYKRNKVNPISGCLPMLIQFPILIAMFRLLPEAIELHGMPFIFWIKDLSAPDHFMMLPFKLPFLGEWLNLLPILMVVSQIGYQQLMPQMAAQPEQKLIMNIMPFFFGFICWTFPSGLVLYWIFQNIFSMLQQLWINRIQTDLHPEDRD